MDEELESYQQMALHLKDSLEQIQCLVQDSMDLVHEFQSDWTPITSTLEQISKQIGLMGLILHKD